MLTWTFSLITVYSLSDHSTLYRKSYMRGPFLWNNWNEPAASFINWNLYKMTTSVRFCLFDTDVVNDITSTRQSVIILVVINRIPHRFLMQTEKSQPKGKWIMPETRFTEFPALSVDPRVWISRSASETDVWLLFTYDIKNSFIFDILRRIIDRLWTSYGVFHGGGWAISPLKFSVLTWL